MDFVLKDGRMDPTFLDKVSEISMSLFASPTMEYPTAINAPILTPTITSGSIPHSSRAFKTPSKANPFAPPPGKTSTRILPNHDKSWNYSRARSSIEGFFEFTQIRYDAFSSRGSNEIYGGLNLRSHTSLWKMPL